jgi:hypothetical protein
MLKDPEQDFIPVNKILGKPASIGIIPANQILPWLILIIIAYTLTNGLFSLGMPWFFGISFWLIVSWWLLTGNQPHLFVDKFRYPPGQEWCNGYLRYLSPLIEKRAEFWRNQIPSHSVRVKLKPLIKPNQDGKKQCFMPFQNFQDLVCLVTIKKDNRSVSGYLLHRGQQYQMVFGFRTPGFHNILSTPEITNTMSALEQGLKDLPSGEKLTIHTGCFSINHQRQQELSKLADDCQLKPVSILIRNEQKRLQELTSQGTRQTWSQIIFCTWTFNQESGSKSQDFISKALNFGTQFSSKAIRWFTGNEQLYQESFYKRLLLKSFEEGYLRWELLFNTKIGLETKPCSSEELWHWLWLKFNHDTLPIPPIPQQIVLEETATDYHLIEIKTTDKDPCTLLIEGQQGRSACPQHKRSHDTVWLPGRNSQCAVLTMTEKPEGWTNQREQLRWLWTILSQNYVHDTEAIAEISTASPTLIQDNLARIAKQSKTAQQRALTKGQGRDAGAEVKAEESFDAQKKLYQGAKALNIALVFLVYRPTSHN